MSTLLEILSYPFMQRALVGGVLLGILLASLGVIATLRRMAFFGEGIAHASLAGLAIAVLTGLSPLPVAILWSLLVALAIFVLEKRTTLPRDTVIGILFTASMSLGVVLMSFMHGYQPELLTFLFGSILAVDSTDVAFIAVATVVILTGLAATARPLVLMSLNEDAARVAGVRTNALTLMLYFALAIAMVLGVHMLGIILVSALLIIPSATARLLSSSLRSYVILANILSVIAVVAGLILSFIFDLPSGATIVLVATAIFAIATVVRRG